MASDRGLAIGLLAVLILLVLGFGLARRHDGSTEEVGGAAPVATSETDAPPTEARRVARADESDSDAAAADGWAVIAGSVRDEDGQPLPHARVRYFAFGDREFAVALDEAGRFSTRIPSSGSVTLEAEAPDRVPRRVLVTPGARLDLVLVRREAPRSVEGFVVEVRDERGEPAPGVEIRVAGLRGDWRASRPEFDIEPGRDLAAGTTDASGRLVLEPSSLTPEFAVHARRVREATLGFASLTKGGLRLELAPAVAVDCDFRIRAVPVTGGSFRARFFNEQRSASFDWAVDESRVVLVAAGGRVVQAEVEGAAPWRGDVPLWGDRRELAIEFSTGPHRVLVIDFEDAPGLDREARGRVEVRVDGRVVHDADVDLHRRLELRIERGAHQVVIGLSRAPAVIAENDGRPVVVDFEPPSVKVMADELRDWMDGREVPNPRHEVRIPLRAAREIRGMVRTPDGRRVPDVDVVIATPRSSTWRVVDVVRTDDRGEFRASAPPEGRVGLFVDSAEHTPFHPAARAAGSDELFPVLETRDANPPAVELVVVETAELEIEVVDAKGEPVPDAPVGLVALLGRETEIVLRLSRRLAGIWGQDRHLAPGPLARTDDEGRARLRGLPPGDDLMIVAMDSRPDGRRRASRGTLVRSLAPAERGRGRIVLDAEPAATLTVDLRSGGRPFPAGVSVALVDVTPQGVYGTRGSSGGSARSDGAGRVRFAAIEPGDYRLIVEGADPRWARAEAMREGRGASETIAMRGADRTVTVELPLEPAGDERR
ncbi:MAG: carboxypeptidase-like regulatory domain-containing protein [Planctomycetota bacterium]